MKTKMSHFNATREFRHHNITVWKTQIFNLRLLKITCNRIIKLLVLFKIKQALRDDKGLN